MAEQSANLGTAMLPDFPTIMDVMGEGLGLDDFFNTLGDGLDYPTLRPSASEPLSSHGPSQSWPAPVLSSDHRSLPLGEALGSGLSFARTPSSSSFGGAPPKSPEFDQLVQMQQQLQTLQASVTAKLQHLQQVAEPALQPTQPQLPQATIPGVPQPVNVQHQAQQAQLQHQQLQQFHVQQQQLPQAQAVNLPELQEMQRMLEHVKGVLAQSQEQQMARTQQYTGTFTFGSSAPPGLGRRPSAGAQPDANASLQQQPASTSALASASRRGKQRNRPLAELERQLEEKQAEAEALMQRNVELKRRQRMLSNFIRVRETQMHRLQQVKAQGVMKFLGAGPAAAAAKRSAMLAGITEDHMKSMDIATSNSFFAAAVQEVSRLLGLAAGHAADAAGGAAPATLAANDEPCTKEEAAAELEVVIRGMTETGYVMMLLHPGFAQIKFEGSVPGSPSVPPPDHWQQVATAIVLEEEQLQDLEVLHDIHRSLSAKVYSRRQQLVLQMQQLLETYSNNIMDSAARHNIQTLTEKLHRSVQQERCILFLATEVFDSMLTAEQAARLVVASYPFKPDELAILSAMLKLWRQRMQEKKSQPVPGLPAMPIVTTC